MFVANKYRLAKELGRGGMGVVYLAEDVELERQVAVKVLLEEHAEDQAAVARFLREAKASVKIQSEHVAHVYETGKLDSGVPYIVMEYLRGVDLAERFSRTGPLTPQEVAEFVLQTCEALAEAHAAGIVHRDLKPANLFLSERPDGSHVLKILDFGISKISTSSVLTRSQTLVGSPYYMSPEQLESAQDVDARADIWALGVIMYELSTGQRPFEGTSLAALCVSVLNAEPQSPHELTPEIPAELSDSIMRCLHKDRKARFQNVAELARALEPLLSPARAGIAARVTSVLQNARTVPDMPRRESDAAAERSASWAQTNRGTTTQHRRGRRFALAVVVILGAAGIGIVVGKLSGLDARGNASFGHGPRAEDATEAPASRRQALGPAASASTGSGAEVTPALPEPVTPDSTAPPTTKEARTATTAPAPATSLSSSVRAGRVSVPRQPLKAAAPEPEVPLDPLLRRH